MSLSVGIVGLPNAGKSTLFNALLGRQIAKAENYPFCTIDPNTGVVAVPDKNLAILAKIEKSRQVVPAAVKFVDIAGLVAGAAKGEGLGNKFLANIRECDVICYVLRGFNDPDVDRAGSIDPQNDLEVLKTELILKDLETIEKICHQKVQSDDKEAILRSQVAKKVENVLEQGQLIINQNWAKNEIEVINQFFLLSAKKYLIVLNIDEGDFNKLDRIKTDFTDWDILPICAKIEAELAQLEKVEQKEYLDQLGVKKSGLELLIRKAYKTLGLISFYTAGEKETRAWTVKKGAKAPQAAGVIHTDFEKNFIKAEIVSLGDLIKFSGWKICREKGKTRFEGRDYEITNKEVVEFKVGV